MEKRQQEIYDDIIERRGPKNPLTKSQKKHLKKVAKKRVRSEKRKAKQLQDQESSGRLIEENHNGLDYSPEFTDKAASRHLSDLQEVLGLDPDQFLYFVRTRKSKYIDLVLKWPTMYPRDSRFWFFKELLDLYWANPGNGQILKSHATSYLECSGRAV